MIKLSGLLAIFLLNAGFLFTHATLPVSRLERYEGVKYLTYTKANKDKQVDIRKINFTDTGNVVVIHGFGAKDLKKPLQVKNDLFNTDPEIQRVIVVDWRDYSAFNYPKVAEFYVPLLAQDLYEKIGHIRKSGSHVTVKLVGHGIGAHVAGQTGRLLKKKDNYKLEQIFALDPYGVGDFFVERWDLGLQTGDAKDIVRFNTNKKSSNESSSKTVEPDDINVNGGQKQPDCKINVNKCSHDEAWNEMSRFLNSKKNASTYRDMNDARSKIHPYVICLDVSGSMEIDKRLDRAVTSAKKSISMLAAGSYVGFVTFNDESTILHKIIQLKSSQERESLLASMPPLAAGWTSIGNGLRTSLGMLQAMAGNTSFCSTIVLISDGEENKGENAKSVMPDLKSNCVKVSTIALGKNASNELEELSEKTGDATNFRQVFPFHLPVQSNLGGVVAYSLETNTSEDLVRTIKAFSYAFEGETDKQINLQSKVVTLSDSEQIIEFSVDDTIGDGTEFSVMSLHLGEVDVRLKAPDGELHLSNSTYYFNDKLTTKGFKIPFADRGQWSLIVRKNSKTRRSARSTIEVTVMGSSHQIGNMSLTLNAGVSNRSLEYPKPITVYAELKFGEFPVIYADVNATIQAPEREIIILPLHDDGIFPDEIANDGIYTNDIVKLPNPERYTVTINAINADTAMSPLKEVNYLLGNALDCKTEAQKCKKLSRFQRETEAGSVKLVSNEGLDKIPPHAVCDLRGVIKNAPKKIVSLEWTSPRNELFDIQIERYDIRILMNGTEGFNEEFKFQDRHVVEGSLNFTNKNEKISVKIPKKEWNFMMKENFTLMKFALKSIGVNKQTSEISNLALVAVSGGSNTFIWQFASHCRSLSQIFAIVFILFKLN